MNSSTADLRARGLIAEQFDDAAQQHATAQFGMWVFLATEVLFFGVLFAGYAVCRVRDPEGFMLGSQHTEILFGAVEAGILLLSSATVTFAVNLIKFDERRVVAARESPHHAMDPRPRPPRDRAVARADDGEAMAVEDGRADEPRAGAQNRHPVPHHVGAISEIEPHRYSGTLRSKATSSP